MEAQASNYLPYSYLYGAGSVSGRIAVPVTPAQLPYANFKNVAGSAVASASVYSLDKLRILDVLIDRLRSARKQLSDEKLPRFSEREDRLDALIQEYGKMLHDSVAASDAQALKGAAAYAKPAGVVPGMLLSFAA